MISLLFLALIRCTYLLCPLSLQFMQRGKARENPPSISKSSLPDTDVRSPAVLAARVGASGSSSAPPALRESRAEGSGMRAGRVEDVEEGWTAANAAGMNGGVNPMSRHGWYVTWTETLHIGNGELVFTGLTNDTFQIRVSCVIRLTTSIDSS